jgi:hypothetical protein
MKDLRAHASFRKPNSVKIVILLCSFVGQLAVSAPAWSDASSDMLKDYKSADYTRLLSDCDKVVTKDPKNAIAHYYRACAWAKMGVGAQAQAEYRTALDLASDPSLRKYCLDALTAYQNGAGQASIKPIGGAQSRATAPIAESTLIEQQADSVSLATLGQANYAHAVYAQAVQQAETMRRQADATANNMASQFTRDRFGNKYPMYTQQQIDATRQQSYDNAADLLHRSKIQTDEAYELAKEKTRWTQESAAALQDQLRSQPKGGIHLIAPGTNLWVRNYASAPGPSTINPAQAYAPDDPGLEATQKSLQSVLHPNALVKGQTSVKTNVTGKLMKTVEQ